MHPTTIQVDYSPGLKRTKKPKSQVVQKLLKNPMLARREINNRSFYEFLRYMWPAISPEEFQPNWHVKYMCDRLQELAEDVVEQRHASYKQAVNDLFINVPPGSTKTTVVMIMFPAWCWSRWYWMEFIGLSYSSGLSLESAEACRELVRSDLYQSVYPDISIKTDKDAKGNFQILKTFENKPGYRASTKQGGSRYSTSVGGTVTGFHAHIILVDDPINPEQAVSPVQLESANRWMDQTLPTRKIHKKYSPMVMIMQRLHENDPTGHQLEEDPDGIDLICLPGEIDEYADHVSPPHLRKNYVDGLLDPVRGDRDVLKKLRSRLGQYGYAGQVGQAPTPPSGGMFKVDELKIIDKLPDPGQNPDWKIEETVRYWDKAGTEEKKGSKAKGPAWSVGVKMARLANGKYVVMNVFRGRWSSGKREEHIKGTTQSDGYGVRVGIEQEPGSGGKESAESTVRNLAGYSVTVDNPTGDKVYRADPFSVQVEYGNVLLLQGPWNKEYIDELRFFPVGTFKDQVDASSGAFKMLKDLKEADVW